MIEAVAVPDSASAVIGQLEGDAAVLAGGTLLMPKVNNEATSIRRLVSTRRIGNDTNAVEDGRAAIGAACTLAAIGANPDLAFLRDAIESIGSPTIRGMATVGGNLFAEQPYGDLAVCLLALDATVDILGPSGSRSLAVAELLGQGVASDELVTTVHFDVPAEGSWFYTKAMRRKLNSASIVTVAAVVTIADGVVESASIALGGAGPVALRCSGAEAALVAKPLTEGSVDGAAAAAVAESRFFSDAYASAWYRERVLPVHFKRAILGPDSAATQNSSEDGR